MYKRHPQNPCLLPPTLSSALWDSKGLVCGSLEEVTPSAALFSTGLRLLPLGDLSAFVGVLAGDLLVVVAVVVSPLDGFLLSWRPLVNFSCYREMEKWRKNTIYRYINSTKQTVFLGEKWCLTVCVKACVVHGYLLTFRASSGTVSSPLTTVNRLVCETERLRKDWLHLWYVIW